MMPVKSSVTAAASDHRAASFRSVARNSTGIRVATVLASHSQQAALAMEP